MRDQWAGAIAVAGHICLDVIPTFAPPSAERQVSTALTPGALLDVGPARFASGGAVANVGLALQRLGVSPVLLGRVGDDTFGAVLLDLLRKADPALAAGMRVATGEPTSYSIVISSPGSDRIFLHCPGVNDTFDAAELAAVSDADGNNVRVLHFGYPPLMRRIYADGGTALADALTAAQTRGIVTSLDMALPDPAAPAGRADWHAFLARVLPHVDLFAPNVNELVFMLGHPRAADLHAARDTEVVPAMLGALAASDLALLAERALTLGAAVVALKLGDQGLYLRTTNDAARLTRLARLLTAGAAPTPSDTATSGTIGAAWRSRELLAPCFVTQVAGTTGSGDATIAGLLVALLDGATPEQALLSAVGVGACSVEATDATSAIPSWQHVHSRIADGWQQAPLRFTHAGWTWEPTERLWRGPQDVASLRNARVGIAASERGITDDRT